VALEINKVAGHFGRLSSLVRAAEEMVIAHLHQGRERSVRKPGDPPMFASFLLARTTMASAFQRARHLMRHSISGPPDKVLVLREEWC